MVLNTEKTKLMLIAGRQNRNHLLEVSISLQYSDIDIRMTTSDRRSDAHLDNDLSWNDQFHHVSKTVSSYVLLLCKIKTYLSDGHRLFILQFLY